MDPEGRFHPHEALSLSEKAAARKLTRLRAPGLFRRRLLAVRFIGQLFLYPVNRKQENGKERGKMKGYYTQNGYWGYAEGRYVLFATEEDYLDYLAE